MTTSANRATPPLMKPRASRLKIVLYNPQAVFFTMPLALLAIGSALDPDVYEVVIIDARLDPDAENTVLSHIDDALCLGVTVLTGAPISDALRISRAAKRARPTLPVVWGGWHPSMFARDCLFEKSVDVMVSGQGEETFAEIVQRLAAGRSLAGCAGCTVRLEDGTIQENPARQLAQVDGFRAHEGEFGADRARVDAGGECRVHGTQAGVPLQRFERDDQRVVADRGQHEMCAAVAPVEAGHRRTQVLLREDALEVRARIGRCAALAPARELTHFLRHFAGLGEGGGVRRPRYAHRRNVARHRLP